MDFPDDMQIDRGTTVEFGVPSWHISAHGADCRSNFGLNYWEGVGRTCGEEIESTWVGTNPLGPSTREMGSGGRHETLNDQWGGMNFRRIVGLGKQMKIMSLCVIADLGSGRHLLHCLKEALIMQERHQQLFVQFSKTFRSETLVSWQIAIDAWKNNHTKPNPYMNPGPSEYLIICKNHWDLFCCKNSFNNAGCVP